MRKQIAVLAFVAVAVAPALVSAPPAPAAGGSADLRVVVFNILHGILCSPDTNDCQADDRVALLGRHLQDARCPEVVALQEVSDRMVTRLTNAPWVQSCGYDVVSHGTPGPDHEFVLTTLPVRSQRFIVLAGNFRGAYRVVLQSKLAPVVLVVSHQDGDAGPDEPPAPCTNEQCPPPCSQSDSIPACQTIQGEQLASRGGPKGALRILSGDFNVTSTSDRYQSLVADGWVDSHLAARNAECDPATGTNCTSGREDQAMDDLEDPSSKEIERIDFILVKSPKGCRAVFDRAADRDRDGLGTGLFADVPVSDGPGAIAFVSDHTGVAADISCK